MRILHNKLAIFICCILFYCFTNEAYAQELPDEYKESVGPKQIARLGDGFLFLTYKDNRCTLWKSDGTMEGTKEIFTLQ